MLLQDKQTTYKVCTSVLIIGFTWALTHHSQHLEPHKSKAILSYTWVPLKLSVVLVQFSCMHTWQSTEELPWRNENNLLSWSSFLDGKLSGKSYCISVCQDKLQDKQNKILWSFLECLAWLGHEGALSHLCSKIPGKGDSLFESSSLPFVKANKSSFKGIYVRGDQFLYYQVSLSFPDGCARLLNQKYKTLQLSQ